MSRYLIRRIEEISTIDLRTGTEIVALEGDAHLERVRWRDNKTGDVTSHNIRHVFLMTGAVPNTGWLAGCLALDEQGFIKTGPDLTQNVRAGNVKRVASAVGEGSIAVSFVHRALAD